MVRLEPGQGYDAWADLRPAVRWIEGKRPIILGGIILVLAQLVWRWQFLRHMYFRQEDFLALDLARRSALSWHYLTYVGAGHLMIGERLLAWLLVRASLYGWTLGSALNLAMLACADLAVFRLLRKLFGERPSVLALLSVYLLYPLALPAFGYWTVAIDSVPLQLAIVMALHAHVCYIQTKRARHLVAAVGWILLGLAFGEQALVLPVLLFAVSAGFLTDRGSWLAGAGTALRGFGRAWLSYGAAMACYAVILAVSQRTATATPQLPRSAGAAWTYAFGVLRETFGTSAFGGPWQWLEAGGSYALAAPPAALSYLALVAAVLIVAASMLRRRIAWRAWVILIGWLVVADMLPVIVTRLNGWFPILLAVDPRYVAEIGSVLVVCLGLAFLPVIGAEGTTVAAPAPREEVPAPERAWRAMVTGALAVFLVGSIWSARAYQSATSGEQVATYIANAEAAVLQASRGTPVLEAPVPSFVIAGNGSSASTVIGEVMPGRLHWIGRLAGTIDGLRAFGPDGKLDPAFVYGAASLPQPHGRNCWPVRHRQISVRFWQAAPASTSTLRIGYLLYGQSPAVVTVAYGTAFRSVTLRPGLHTAYVPVTGSVGGVVVNTGGAAGVCIGDVEAGTVQPAGSGSPKP